MYIIEPMTMDDIEEVAMVERRCFTNPWPLSAYRRELRFGNKNYYIVLRDDPLVDADQEEDAPYQVETVPLSQRRNGRFRFWPLGKRDRDVAAPPIIGFAGMWQLMDEAHVTTIGVRPDYQGRGLGELLFLALMDEARHRDAHWVSLEVRVSNYGAQALYRKYEFSIQGKRPRYYSDNQEDAYIMWSESLRDVDYWRRIEALRRRLHHKLSFPHS